MKLIALLLLLFYFIFSLNSCQQPIDKKLVDTINSEAGEVGKRVIDFENNLNRLKQTYDSLNKAINDTLGEIGMKTMTTDSVASLQFKQINEEFEKNYKSFESITGAYKSFLLEVNAFVDSLHQNKLKPEEILIIWSAKKAQSDELYAQGESMTRFLTNWQAKFTIFFNESLRFKAKQRPVYYQPIPSITK